MYHCISKKPYLNELFSFHSEQGYPELLINDGINEVKQSTKII